MLTFWTDERVDELKAHWIKGHSAAVIAADMRTTRNSVLGKIHRLGLSSRTARVTAQDRPRVRVQAPKPALRPKSELKTIVSSISHMPITIRRRPDAPQGPELSKAQLRAQLTQAVINTAALA